MNFFNHYKLISLTKRALLIIYLLIGSISISYSVNRTWDGSTSGDWNTATNWSGDAVPTSADNAIFNGTYTNPCVLNVVATYTVVSVTFQNTFNTAFTIAAGGSLTFTGLFSMNGTAGGVFNMTGGTLTGRTPGVSQANFNFTLGAVCNFTGGTMTFAKAFVVNTGSTFNMPSGTPILNVLSTSAAFSVRDKNGGTSSLFDMDAGTVNCATIAEVNGMSTGSSPELNISGGTFNTTASTSHLQFTGGIWTTFGDAPVINISGGTVSIEGSLINGPAADDVRLLMNISGGNVTFDGGIYLRDGTGAAANSDVLTITGASTTVTFSGAFSTIVNYGLIDASGATGTSKIVIADNTTLDDGTAAGTFKFPGVTINSGKTLDQTGVPAIEVYGDWTNDGGTYTHGNGLVTFRGGIARNITGTSSTTFYGLTINNTSATGVTLLKPVTVTNALTLTDGILFTDATNLLTLNDGATSSSGSAASFIDGPMKKTGDDAFVFPLGDGTVWARLGISDPGADPTQEYTAQYVFSTYSVTSVTGGLNNVSIVEYWTLNQSGGTDDVRITLYWESDTRSGITTNSNDLQIARYNGADWAEETSTIDAFGPPGTITTDAVVPNYSPFTFASRAGTNPLPIELLNFEASCNQGTIGLNWTTASETNNDYFTIEKTRDAINYETIGIVKGSGNSHSARTYEATDENPYHNITYYRLKQTDYDGAYSYFGPIAVDCTQEEATDEISSLVYHSQQDITCTFYIETADYGHYELLDMSGKKYLEGKAEKGYSRINLSVQDVNEGVYLFKLVLPEKLLTKKVAIVN